MPWYVHGVTEQSAFQDGLAHADTRHFNEEDSWALRKRTFHIVPQAALHLQLTPTSDHFLKR
eukprot:4637527-Amphidinium_carterae.1